MIQQIKLAIGYIAICYLLATGKDLGDEMG